MISDQSCKGPNSSKEKLKLKDSRKYRVGAEWSRRWTFGWIFLDVLKTSLQRPIFIIKVFSCTPHPKHGDKAGGGGYNVVTLWFHGRTRKSLVSFRARRRQVAFSQIFSEHWRAPMCKQNFKNNVQPRRLQWIKDGSRRSQGLALTRSIYNSIRTSNQPANI